ncbi:unnamed protein product [Ambrosiozyma monospora]|uniref:Unnamed protein product n=1 Tax=Ambrosiozyma monospora TaxID=43982 RepID=A0ACB5SSQ9_AMBMO|nr:unnamed protein product [Ambrosiozyma monospora]
MSASTDSSTMSSATASAHSNIPAITASSVSSEPDKSNANVDKSKLNVSSANSTATPVITTQTISQKRPRKMKPSNLDFTKLNSPSANLYTVLSPGLPPMDAKSTSKVLLSRDIELQQKRLINERKGLSTPNSSCSSSSMSANSAQSSRHPATLSELDLSSTADNNNNANTANGSANPSKHSSPASSPLPQNKRFKRSRPPKPLNIPTNPAARRLIPPAMMSAPLRGGLAGGHLAASHHQLPYPYQPQVLVSATAAQFPQPVMVGTPIVQIPVHPSALVQQQQQQLIHSRVAARGRNKQFKVTVDDDGKFSIKQQQQQQQLQQQPQPQFIQQPFQQGGFYQVPMSATRPVARANGGDNSTNGSGKNGHSYSMVYSSIREVPIERTPITDVYLEDVKDAPAPTTATSNDDQDKINNSEASNSDTTSKKDQPLPSSATSASSVTATNTPMNEKNEDEDDEDDVESCAIEDELASPPKTQSKTNSAIPSAKPNTPVVNDKTSQQQQETKGIQPVMIKLGDCVYSFDGVLSKEKFVEAMSFVYDSHVKGVS